MDINVITLFFTRKAATFSLLIILLSLALPAHGTVNVATVAELQQAVSAANSGGGDKTIHIQPGTYQLNGAYLRITADNVSVAGTSGKRGDVILDGGYSSMEIFQIVASNVTIRDLTIKRAVNHPIHAMPSDSHDSTGILIDNIHIIDPGQQAIKINQNSAKTHSVNSGIVSNSLIELTDTGRAWVWDINGSCYTGGVDTHHATGWQIRDNEIRGFWCANGLSEHGVHFWSNSQNTLVERNKIIDCDRGIGFGLGGSGHQGGIIRNNMIYHGPDHGHSDVGIGLESASNVAVYNNTIFHEHSYPNAIEYRFSVSTGNYIANTLTNRSIASRDGGKATLAHNTTEALSSWFVNTGTGDLHLGWSIPGVIDSGASVPGLLVDIDKEHRPQGRGVDIGADEKINAISETTAINSTYILLLKN